MRKMIIAIPCWGHRYASLFFGPGIASIRAAIAELEKEFRDSTSVKFVVRTDRPEQFARELGDYELHLVPPPGSDERKYRSMSGAHRVAIEAANHGDRVVLFCADMVMSTETLVAVETRFRQGKKAVLSPGVSTGLWPWQVTPAPMKARTLKKWSMAHANRLTNECVWGRGWASFPSQVFFKENGAIVCRSFHVHPIAIVKDRPLPFDGTLDIDLIDNYHHAEIHVATDLDELALAEISPKKRSNGEAKWPLDVSQIVAWAIRGARPMHWWNFRHRIAVVGDPSAVKSDAVVADEVMRLCPYPAALEAAI